jgi:transposase
MGKAKQLSQQQRCQIIALSRHTSKTHREIAIDLNVSQSSVTKIINLHKSTGGTTVRERSGRPRITSETTDRMMRREVVKDPFITPKQIQQNLASHLEKVSLRTIRRRLQAKYGMTARKPLKKPLLTLNMRKKRLLFCKRHKEWTVEMWKKVLFSDESTFQQHTCMPTFVRRLPGSSALHPRYTLKTVKHSPGVMVWGCFSFCGTGALTFLDKGARMNSTMYTNILDVFLKNSMTRLRCNLYQQDNAPCHTSKSTMAWFKKKRIRVLEWPGNSPDLNPIENLWQLVKNKINRQECSSLSALKEEILRVWNEVITPELCAKLVQSMPRRIAAVTKNHGYPIKY